MAFPSVDITALQVRFGAVEAVRHIDVTVHGGGSTALVGRNGAGKSTTMRVLAGVIPPAAGTGPRLRLRRPPRHSRGQAPDRLLPRRRRPDPARHPVGAPPALGPAAPARCGWEDQARDLLEQFDLGGAAHRVTSGFSHGMGRRMSVVLAAFHQPEVLLLDEPFDGVDPLGVEATLDVINDARRRGAAVLVSTHLLELAVEACDEAVILRGGLVVGAQPADQLRGDAGAATYRSLLA